MQSIFRKQPPNLKEHNGVVNDSQGLFKIDYAPYLSRWFSRHTASRNGRTEQNLILVNIYDPQSKKTFEWCRPDLRVIVEGEDISAISRLLKEDVANYLL